MHTSGTWPVIVDEGFLNGTETKQMRKQNLFVIQIYGVNADKENERINIFSHFKLPGNAAENLSNTYEEYGVNLSYAVYKLDDSYEEYIEKYQDYGRFPKFKSRVYSSISSYNTCTNSVR